jgi:hypothetical protein
VAALSALTDGIRAHPPARSTVLPYRECCRPAPAPSKTFYFEDNLLETGIYYCLGWRAYGCMAFVQAFGAFAVTMTALLAIGTSGHSVDTLFGKQLVPHHQTPHGLHGWRRRALAQKRCALAPVGQCMPMKREPGNGHDYRKGVSMLGRSGRGSPIVGSAGED